LIFAEITEKECVTERYPSVKKGKYDKIAYCTIIWKLCAIGRKLA